MNLLLEATTPSQNQLLTLAPLALSLAAFLLGILRVLAFKKLTDLEKSDKENKDSITRIYDKYDKELDTLEKDLQKMETSLELVNQKQQLDIKAIQDQIDLRFGQIVEILNIKLDGIHENQKKLHNDYMDVKKALVSKKEK